MAGTGRARGGATKAVHYFQSRAECNWLAAKEPDGREPDAAFRVLSGYLDLRLTGRSATRSPPQVG